MTPSTDASQRWLDELAFQLRLRGADGRGTGDALAQVREHLAESGESAQDAFGDPAAYAAALDLPDASGGPAALARAASAGLVGYAGLSLAARGLSGLASGRAAITVGDLVAVGCLAVAGAALALAARAILASRARLALWFGLSFAAVVASGFLFRTPVASLPPVVAIVLGVAILAGGIALLARRAKADPIVDPARSRPDA